MHRSEQEQKIEMMFVSLRTDYAQALPKKIRELEIVVQRAKKQPEDKVFLQYAYMHLHRMKGTVGSYGFSRLSELIAEIELTLQKLESCTVNTNKLLDARRAVDSLLDSQFSEAKEIANALAVGAPI
jgi:chemotaxis protein histidine kinase CheA